ncbi:hypothetical protein DB88DRAFT_479636 [Papiliotrema laurentii]|uniref:Uncharacterized protein n=1 Tax=Papiliotrema laurentii TaxID=5418 RepID=A0AAD9FX25_PAPLA|nr:hypothetical protein DB88DRAFT_479636 [Papiliotrema laurentii]
MPWVEIVNSTPVQVMAPGGDIYTSYVLQTTTTWLDLATATATTTKANAVSPSPTAAYSGANANAAYSSVNAAYPSANAANNLANANQTGPYASESSAGPSKTYDTTSSGQTASPVGYNASSGLNNPYSSLPGNSTISQVAGDGGTSSNPSTTFLKAGIPAIIVLLTIAAIYVYVRRRRTRERAFGQQRDMDQLPTTQSATQSRLDLARTDLYDVVPLPPPPPVRYSQVPGVPARSGRPAPPLPPRRGDLPPSLAALPGRDRRSMTESSWADDSELDALATDGSSLARTISTYSTSSLHSDATATLSSGNPFDHPAYTLISATRRPAHSSSAGLTLTGDTAIPTGTWTSLPSTLNVDTMTASDPFADGQTPLLDETSPISPLSLAVTTTSHRSRAGLDEIFGGNTPATVLSRGTTFIQHIDAGRAPSQRAGVPEPGRVGEGEVHIPPTYMELYPGEPAGRAERP